MSNEVWSEWIDRYRRPSFPVGLNRSDEVEFKAYDDPDTVVMGHLARDLDWRDIIAYRYKIEEADMHPDLKKIAYNFSVWPKWAEKVQYVVDNNSDPMLSFVESGSPIISDLPFFFEGDVKVARQQLGLDQPPITDSFMTSEEENEYFNQRHDVDNVNHPPHYQLRPGYEVYDLRQDLAKKARAAQVPHDQYSDWDRALEYLIRMWDKNGVEDAKKARWYMDKLIGKLK